MAENAVFKVAELGARLDTDLGERRPRLSAGTQSFGLAATPVQRQQKLRPQVLPERVLGREGT